MTVNEIAGITLSEFVVYSSRTEMKIFDSSTDTFEEFKQIRDHEVLGIIAKSESDGGSRTNYLILKV